MSKDISIYHVLAEASEGGGLAVTIPTLASRMRRFGVESTIVSGRSAHICKTDEFSHIQAGTLGTWQLLRGGLDSASVVHIHSLWRGMTLASGLASRVSSRPYMISPRGALFPPALEKSALKKRAFWPFQRSIISRSSCLHVTSTEELACLADLGFQSPICVIPNGVDVPSTLQSPSGGRTMLFLGRVVPHKNVHLLVDVWRELSHDFPEWTLKIAGPSDASYTSSMRLSPEERIDLTGPVYGPEKSHEYSSADCYVLPTKSENFGMTIAEALAHGRPVITTHGAPWGGLKKHRCGWWIEHGKAELAKAMREAMSLPREELNIIGARGRDWVARDYSWEKSALMHKQVYEWLLRRSPTPPETVWFPTNHTV